VRSPLGDLRLSLIERRSVRQCRRSGSLVPIQGLNGAMLPRQCPSFRVGSGRQVILQVGVLFRAYTVWMIIFPFHSAPSDTISGSCHLGAVLRGVEQAAPARRPVSSGRPCCLAKWCNQETRLIPQVGEGSGDRTARGTHQGFRLTSAGTNRQLECVGLACPPANRDTDWVLSALAPMTFFRHVCCTLSSDCITKFWLSASRHH
jgi:hypothetical protein